MPATPSRGMGKEYIFYIGEDKLVFIEKLNETFNKYSVGYYAYRLNKEVYGSEIRADRRYIQYGLHTSITELHWVQERNVTGHKIS